MDMVAYFRRLLVYDDWANREIASVMRKTGTPPRSLRFLAHIVAAESLWLVRLKQEKKLGPVWPELSLEQCEQEVNRLAEAWREYVASLTPQLLGEKRAYTNSKGEPWESTVEDIRHGRDDGYPPPPARIPACSFPAPGSSEILASARS